MGIQPRRHQYLIEPDAGVFTTPSLMELGDRIKEFLNDTALPPEKVIVTPVVQIPLPVTNGPADGRVQAAAVMMWFPLFWLPQHVGARRTIPEEDGQGRPESNAEWAVRVMSMCAAAGLFDPATGTWLDALSTVGLDADDDDVQARVQTWQAGGADPDLDRIDLTDLFLEGEADAAGEAALLITPDLLGAQYALTASEISESIAAMMGDKAMDAEAFTGAATLFLVLASQGFVENPDAQSIPMVLSKVQEMLTRLQSETAAEGVAADPVGYLQELDAICTQVVLTFSPFLDLITTLSAEMEPPERQTSAAAPLEPVGWDTTETKQETENTVVGW